jgi:hypothetical protein
MIDNLKNVAIPGTGVPLSWFCYNYYICLFSILFINPFVCLMGAIHKSFAYSDTATELLENVEKFYISHLLNPDDWFSFWRLNCRLVSYHSHVTQSIGYKQEDKWTFLTDGKKLDIPISPYIENIENLVCKNKNIEGGMGIFFYKNALNGGDWILQEKLNNAKWLVELLPINAPLSTMRIISTSTLFVEKNKFKSYSTENKNKKQSDNNIFSTINENKNENNIINNNNNEYFNKKI